MLGFYAPIYTFAAQPMQREELPEEWPDYIVFMASEALRTVTGSMNEIYSGTESFFFHVNRMLAYDRTMRELMAWAPPAATPWVSAMPHGWAGYYPYQLQMPRMWPSFQHRIPFVTSGQELIPRTFRPASLPPFYTASRQPAYPTMWDVNPYLTRHV